MHAAAAPLESEFLEDVDLRRVNQALLSTFACYEKSVSQAEGFPRRDRMSLALDEL